MGALYFILPLALVIAGLAVAAFVWTVRSGQLDDVDTPPRRMLFDDAPQAVRPPAQPAQVPRVSVPPVGPSRGM